MPVDVGKMKQGDIILKHIEGLPGDKYVVTEKYLEVNGRRFPIVRGLKGLPEIDAGEYVVPEGKCLMMNYPKDSLDSRYFGPVVPKRHVTLLVPMPINSDREKLEKSWQYSGDVGI